MSDSPLPGDSADVAPAKARPGRAKKGPQRPPRPVPHPLLDRLAALHPALFGARFLPLKVGVFEDLMARHPGEFEKEPLKAALGFHARSTRYLEVVAAGEQRHDLDGQPVEPVAPEHRHHALMEVFRRRQARTPQDLRPWLHERLVQAIDASGLEREAYLERVHTRDANALEALDAAFALIGERTAKRDALRRAFQASGKSIEDFAEMYGMDVDAVRAAVEAK